MDSPAGLEIPNGAIVRCSVSFRVLFRLQPSPLERPKQQRGDISRHRRMSDLSTGGVVVGPPQHRISQLQLSAVQVVYSIRPSYTRQILVYSTQHLWENLTLLLWRLADVVSRSCGVSQSTLIYPVLSLRPVT